MLTTQIQRVPPNTPVYSYHCTQSGLAANPLPRFSQGQEKSQFKCSFSKQIQASGKKINPTFLPNFLSTRRHSKTTSVIKLELTNIAKNIPKAVAFQSHQVAMAFQTKKPKKTREEKAQNPSFFVRSMSHNKGTNATKSKGVNPDVGQERPSNTPNNNDRMIFTGILLMYNFV